MTAAAHHRYRAEIDGLRTVAVLPVVLFHAGIETMSGGFVGVDIFFVISGFLITGILTREIGEGRFSILTFYERRIRRIVPNLLAALTLTTLAALLILIPVDLKLYAQSVAATLAFAANIFFWLKVGYFTPNAEQFPLLHMWSLGVEEQYYLLFPLLMLMLAGARGRWLRPVLWSVFALSLALSAWQVRAFPEAAFYLPFGRLWELMAGSLLAVGAVAPVRSAPAREALGWAGMLAIGAAIFLYDADMPFPGIAALLPCFGAVAIIHATGSGPTQVARLLSLRPMVFVGAISYSLYIWHWPIVVFTRYCLQRPLTALEILVVLAATFAIAIAAWKWIEQPWRQRTVPVARLLRFSGFGAATLAGVAVLLMVSAGWPGRYPASARAIALAPADTNPIRALCDRPSVERSNAGDVCHMGVTGVAPTFAFIGDSFADALAPGVDAAAKKAGVAGLLLTQSGCAPLVGVNEPGSLCQSRTTAMYALVRRTPSIRVVLLAGRWPAMVEGRRFGLFEKGVIRLVDRQSGVPDVAENPAVMERGFLRSIAAVAPAKVTILTGVPEQKVNVPQAATIRTLVGGDLSGVSRAAYDRRQARTLAILGRVAQVAPFRFLDVGPVLCGARDCPMVDRGMPLYADDNHPTRSSSIGHAYLFDRVMQDASISRGERAAR